jgi:hypothetical protein
MYVPGRDDDVPAPYDEEEHGGEKGEEDIGQLLVTERGNAQSKASKRSLTLLDAGANIFR